MTTRRDTLKLLGGSAALALSGGLARAQAPAQPTEDWDKVIAAAKKEGRLTMYSGAPGRPEHRDIAKLYEKKYGIRVDVLDGPGSEIQARIQSEVSSGHVNGDVSHIGGTTQVLMQSLGQLAPHGYLPNEKKLVIEPKVPEEVPIFVNSYGILVNTDMVPADQQPTSWLDLLDPKWKGKILMYPGWFSGSGLTWFGVMEDAFGEQYHEKMARQEPVFGQAVRENPRRVARGEYPIYVPFTITDIGALEGLPIKAIVPKEGVAYTPFSVAIIKGAQHPNAARLMLNFFLEPEAQLVYAHNGFGLAVGGLEDQVPEKWKWAVNAKLLGRQKLEGQEERMQRARKIYTGK